MTIRKAMLSDTIHSEEAANCLYACYSCNQTTDIRTTLKRCSRCRLAWYCSSQCQKDDWKAHKRFCSKANFDLEVVAVDPEKPDDFIGCPKAVQGFVRTPALWRQIWYLSKKNLCSLTIISISHPRVRPLFRAASESLPAVHMMLNIVESAQRERSLDLTLEQVRRQFETEYRVSTTETARLAAGEFALPTPHELEEEWSYLQQRMAHAVSLGMY
ncbi:hypothetical protein DFH09DRAFT_620491 [Mycena vulgaris]|nr:hypothetical protein DFH09DRAFT_620491 [Mycena vulgaris]